MEVFLVAFGGAFGALARYKLGHFFSVKSKSVIFGTFFVNILGAFLLGCISAFASHHSFYILLADGFLAAFTTFSTFMYEGFNLFREKKILNAILYISFSILLGIIFFCIGAFIFRGRTF